MVRSLRVATCSGMVDDTRIELVSLEAQNPEREPSVARWVDG